MDKRTRGFKHLVGRTITSVDATCVNQVILTLDDGSRVMIDAEPKPIGPAPAQVVSVITAYKESFIKKPEPVRPKPPHRRPAS